MRISWGQSVVRLKSKLHPRLALPRTEPCKLLVPVRVGGFWSWSTLSQFLSQVLDAFSHPPFHKGSLVGIPGFTPLLSTAVRRPSSIRWYPFRGIPYPARSLRTWYFILQLELPDEPLSSSQIVRTSIFTKPLPDETIDRIRWPWNQMRRPCTPVDTNSGIERGSREMVARLNIPTHWSHDIWIRVNGSMITITFDKISQSKIYQFNTHFQWRHPEYFVVRFRRVAPLPWNAELRQRR